MLVVALAIPFMPATQVLAAGWLGSWGYRVKLTVDNTDIDGALANFPILLYISTSSGRNSEDISFVFDELQNNDNRKKIAVTTTDGTTECYVEIDMWDDANEKAWLWVEAPNIASGADTDFYLYYDSAHADNDAYVGDTDDVIAESVWDGDFLAVHHMRDDPDTSHIKDSTSNDNDGTKTAANEPIVVASVIGQGQTFDGTDDKITLASGIEIGASDTVEVWMMLLADPITNETIWGSSDPLNEGYLFALDDENIRIEDDSGDLIYWLPTLVKDTWYHVVVTNDDSDWIMYLDGVLAPEWGAEDYTYDSPLPNVNMLGSGYFTFGNIRIDEFRISDTERTLPYAKASYESGRDDLLDWSSEEAWAVPTITTVVCSGFDQFWAIVNGEITDEGDASVTQVGFDYGLTSAYGSSSTKTGTWNTDDEFWIKLAGLDAGSVYHFRAKAYNGIWGYGSDVVFSTEGSSTLYEYVNTGGTIDGDDCYEGNWSAQQFTVLTIAHSLDFANIYVKRTGSPGDVILSLRHADGADKPTGIDLDSVTLDADNFSAALNWEKFDFPGDYTLEAGESYALVLRCPNGGAADYLEWREAAGSVLADAVASYSTDSGISWTVEGAGADFLFEVWGEPVFEVLNAQVFTGYIETGDWLIVTTYRNYFAPYYPDESCPANFYLRLLDDTTMIAQTNCPGWGYRPGSFYFSKALADSMEWGNTDYKIRLYGDVTDTPYTDYSLVAADWRGADLEFLDSWIIQQANLIESDTGITLVTTVTDKGEVLNSIGRYIFTQGIYDIENVRGEYILEWAVHQTEYEESTYTDALQEGTDWEVKVGATVATMLTSGGLLLGITGQQVGMMIFVMAMLAIIAILAMKGHLPIGIMLAFVPMLLGAWLGFISYIILGVIVLVLGGGIFVYKVWLTR